MAPSSTSMKTNTSTLPPAILAQSPHLPSVVKLLNYAYDQSHMKSGLLPPDPTTRLQSQTQLSHELEPDGFTILMFSSEISQDEDVEGLMTNREDGATLIATVSAKPYALTQLNEDQLRAKTHLLFKRPPSNHNGSNASMDERRDKEDDGWPKWEILAMAVHPTLQGRGLASRLLEQVIAEIKSRASASLPRHRHDQSGVDGANQAENLDDEGKVAKGKVMLMLSTMLEINEAYYLKRGFISTDVRKFGPGTMGSRCGFSAVEMMRFVDL